jgi:hypothetical protein
MTASGLTLPVNGPRPDVVTTAARRGVATPRVPDPRSAEKPDPRVAQPPPPYGEDRVELSDAARGHAERAERPPRPGVVERVRNEILADTYLTDEKLDLAVERLYRVLLG